ncbi:hypothetical protein C0216_18800 [Streptomyces globosus]|uniref:Ig-like domain-containing protein n=1 Tax=Streptomyces globosus TaxID=68209 RepID=A0A344U2U8_9ACTN|nr:hypothetical protein [Streptomyces globosus]AXE25219.1 hypothetical protein C0216_18800 [Streptomyces globosus]
MNNDDDEYSATVLGSHWIDRPPEPRDAVPDRVEGSVLRFGPGVTAAAPAPFPVVLPPRARRRPEWRRYTLAGAVLLGVLGYLAWQEWGPGLAVREVSAATADGRDPGCDSTADVVAVVRTNGRPGTITYRWLRSDGTRTEALSERVPRGRDEARLHLLWTFRGEGVYEASATVEIVSPDTRTARTAFTYRCDR